MVFVPKIHHRRSTRLKSWDYSWSWWYYVTICAYERQCLFGEIVIDEMRLNSVGRIVEEEWLRTPEIRKSVELDLYVVMPNHIHGIIIVNDDVGTHRSASLIGEDKTGARGKSVVATLDSHVGAHSSAPLRRKPRSLGSFVAGFKSVVTKRINVLRNSPGRPVWQRGFHDHIIRNEADLVRIREYIRNNPLRWALDEENPNVA